MMMSSLSIVKAASIFLCLFLMALPAQAYIGPGLGVAGVWMLLGPIAAIIVTIVLLAYFPARYYYKKHQYKKKQQQNDVSNNDS